MAFTRMTFYDYGLPHDFHNYLYEFKIPQHTDLRLTANDYETSTVMKLDE